MSQAPEVEFPTGLPRKGDEIRIEQALSNGERAINEGVVCGRKIDDHLLVIFLYHIDPASHYSLVFERKNNRWRPAYWMGQAEGSPKVFIRGWVPLSL